MSHSLWRMGVGVRVPNPHFHYATVGHTRFEGIHLAGDPPAITIDRTVRYPNTAIENLLANGDRLRLGPSTHEDSPGATEIAVATGFSILKDSAFVTINASIANSYNDEDPIEFVGTQCAGGWFKNGSDPATYELATLDLGGVEGLAEVGERAQRFIQSSNSTPTDDRFEALLPDGSLKNGKTYRVGLVHFFSGSDWELGFAWDGTTYPGDYTSVISQSSTDSDFVVTEGTFTPTVLGRRNQRIYLAPDSGQINGTISGVWCEHMPLTDIGGTYYELPVMPDLSSLSVTPIRAGDDIKTYANHVLRSYNYTGHEGFHERYIIRAEYTNVAVAMYQTLQRLETLCRMGEVLTLRHYLPNVPSVLYGKLKIEGFAQTTLDVGLCTFAIEFVSE